MKKNFIITKEHFEIRLREALRHRSVGAMYNALTDHDSVVVARFDDPVKAYIAFDDYCPVDVDLSGFHGDWIECECYKLETEFVPETEEEEEEENKFSSRGDILWIKYSEYPPEDDEDDEDGEKLD